MDFSKHGRDTQTNLKLIGESLIKKFHLSYFKKCPSEHDAMCPSKHDAMCPSEHELKVIQN